MGIYDIPSTSTARLLYRVKALETGNLRLRRGSYGPVTGIFSRSRNASLDSSGNVDPTRTGFLKKGALPPSANTNGFAYTSTANSIHWYWDGSNGSTIIQIRRADDSQEVVKGGDINITGLTGATTYYFYPFWTSNGHYDVGWVIGHHGTPKIAFLSTELDGPDEGPTAAAQQFTQDREQLTTGAMTALTGGGGSAGGGGDPTRGGACVMDGTDIQIWGDSPYHIEVLEEHEWIYIELNDGRNLTCTKDHPLYHTMHGRVEAKTVKAGQILLTDKGERMVTKIYSFIKPGIKKKVVMAEGHIFTANGLISHNTKQSTR